MEVLAARHRLGETLWPFDTRCMPAIRKLAEMGLVNHKHGIVDKTEQVWLTDHGRESFVMADYIPPIFKKTGMLLRAHMDCTETWCMVRQEAMVSSCPMAYVP